MVENIQTYSNELSPEPLQQMGMSFMPAAILTAGLQLNIFSHLAVGHHSAREIAAAAGAPLRGISLLLDALVALQLLLKIEGEYQLTPISAKFLVRESADYCGAMYESPAMSLSWANLAEAIRHDKPAVSLDAQATAEEFFPALTRSLHIFHRYPAKRMAEVLDIGAKYKGLRVLDVACGSGVWGIAIAQADKNARITMQDFPTLLEQTRIYLAREGAEAQCEFLAGDIRELDFGETCFDLAILGNIVHSLGEVASQKLFKDLHRALVPGGRVAIIDMIPNGDRSSPPFPVMFALTMFLHTDTGSTYTLAEYTQWLLAAGFTTVETADIGSHSPLIIATK